MKHFTKALFVFVLLMGSTAYAQRITVTIAGNGFAGYANDGDPGKQSMIHGPYNVCVDAAKNIYYSDMAPDGRIRKINARNGTVTTVAGGGISMADGIPATNALLITRHMCLDDKGNIYVVSSSDQVRKIDAVTNIITTVAGIWGTGYTGDGGPATDARFNNIGGICVDKTGNLYIVDRGNNCIRKVNALTGIVNIFAGKTSGTSVVPGYTGDGGPATTAALEDPLGICVNSTGDIYFSDQNRIETGSLLSYIRKVKASTGIISTIAGGGALLYDVPGLSANLGNVSGLCIDNTGSLYFNEISCSCRKLDVTTDTVSAIAGDFLIESFSDNINSQIAYMNRPFGMCADRINDLYIADSANNRIRKLIQLTPNPIFAYGQGQTVTTCPETVVSLDTLLAITDLDTAQVETWTIIKPPAHGIITGFPATTTCMGMHSLTTPTGTAYVMSAPYMGTDSFSVMVSDGTHSDTIVIYAAPNSGKINGPNRVCIGSVISLEDRLPGGTWSTSDGSIASISGAGIVTGIQAGTVTISYTTTGDCGVINTSRTVKVDRALQTHGYIIGPEHVCNQSTTIYSDSIDGGLWKTYGGNITPDGTLTTGISLGTVVISYTLNSACAIETDWTYVIIDYCDHTAVNDVATSEGITIYPTPASSLLNIKWNNLTGTDARITITDMTGRMVISKDHISHPEKNSVTALDISVLKEGAYILSVNTASTHFTEKILINHY